MTTLKEYTQEGFWEITVAPATKKERIQVADMESILSSSQVRHRGWPFPFLRPQDKKLYMKCYQSITIGEHVPKFEGFRLYEDGLFYWKGAMWENFEGGYGKTVLSFGNVNWEITEMMLFTKRLYEQILSPEETMRIKIRLGGCKDRLLYDRQGWGTHGTRCAENILVIEENLNCSQIKASWQELARKYMKKVYVLFGVTPDEESMIKSQNELLKMKLI